MPRVLNKRTDKIPQDAVYVGRPSKWGNQFVIGKKYNGMLIDREHSISQYKDWLLYSDKGQELLKDINELKGKDLVCWCSPLPCHADVLLELANEEPVNAKNSKWFEYCKDCKRWHLMSNQPCPTCGKYEVPQPVSEKIKSRCHVDYSCDGCIDYRDHLR